jgi:tRNA A37 methylthiotransferase MiaB
MKLRDWVDFYKSEKRKIEKKIFAPKVFFFYFHPISESYTPLDIGYVLAKIKAAANEGDACREDFQIEIVPVYFDPQHRSKNKTVKKFSDKSETEKIVRLLKEHRPLASFFFLDNVLWSGFWGIGRAVDVISSIRRQEDLEDFFIGFQSHKITEKSARKIFDLNIIDCWIGEHPEESFLCIEEIIKKKKMSNVYYNILEGNFDGGSVGLQKRAFQPSDFYNSNQKSEFIDNSSPSPYLDDSLKEFLSQVKNIEKFNCFLYSSFGCVFGCYYCFRSVKFENLRLFSPQRFFDEIEYLVNNFGFLNFTVLDDFFIISALRLEELVLEFEKRKKNNSKLAKIKLNVMSRIETLDSPEVVRCLKKINVVKIQIGLQTVNPKLDLYMRREKRTALKLKLIKEWLDKEGILCSIDIIAGLPNDDLGYFKKTVDFAVKLKPSFIQIKQLYVNPNTFFYFKKKEYGIITESCLDEKFSAEFALQGNFLEKDYYPRALNYSKRIAEKNSEIGFKVVFQNEAFLRKALKVGVDEKNIT